MQLHTPKLHGSHATKIQCPDDVLQIPSGWIAHPKLNIHGCSQQLHMRANTSLHDACMQVVQAHCSHCFHMSLPVVNPYQMNCNSTGQKGDNYKVSHLDAYIADACQPAYAPHEVICCNAAVAALRVCIQQNPAVLGPQGVNDCVPSEARHIEECLHGLQSFTPVTVHFTSCFYRSTKLAELHFSHACRDNLATRALLQDPHPSTQTSEHCCRPAIDECWTVPEHRPSLLSLPALQPCQHLSQALPA